MKTYEIKDVVVDKISLVSSDETPAVPKAETRFAFFKTLFAPKKLNQEQINKVQELSNKYKLSSLITKYSF